MKKRQMLLAVVFMLALVVAFFPADTQAKKKAKVKLNKTSATLAPGGTVQLKLQNNKKKVKWSSSKTSVATVSGSGLVTAKAAGNSTITAKVGKKSYKCKIAVKNVRVTIPQRGTKTDEAVRYVYKVKDAKPTKLGQFIYADYDDKADADKRYPADKYDYVGELKVEMTDSWVGYQNFDAVVENYKGAHRYDVCVGGKCTIPAEVAALVKTKNDVESLFDIRFSFTGWKSFAPYTSREAVAGGTYRVLGGKKQKGVSINTIYDKTAGTFTIQATDVTGTDKADYGEIVMNWNVDVDDDYDDID
jgi:hypothetical protein